MVYERSTEPLAARKRFAIRLLKGVGIASAVLVFSLGIGIAGYRQFGHLGWVDSLYNASMILTGMGPVTPMTDAPGKIFASFYALFSGIAFLSSVGVLIAPIVHRFMHRFHLELDEES